MSNYAAARTNMVDSQIHTAGVISDPVLEAFRSVPREMFVAEELRGLVYADEDLPLGQGHFLMEPATLARMIETVEVKEGDRVLNIGDSTGYSTAILSRLATTVMTLDQAKDNDVFSLIFMNGAVAEIPQTLLEHLSLRGRLITIVKPAGVRVGTVTLIERIGDGHYSTRKFFEAGTPYIPGFEPQPGFTF